MLGCSMVLFDGRDGRPRSCPDPPTQTAVVWLRERRLWMRTFRCAAHAADLRGLEPMTARHYELLDQRRTDWAAGLTGRRYVGPPMSTDRTAV